jgi:hypothetical protein
MDDPPFLADKTGERALRVRNLQAIRDLAKDTRPCRSVHQYMNGGELVVFGKHSDTALMHN